jgi:hypothetical protein
MIRSKPSHLLTQFRSFKESAGARAIVPIACLAIVVMTPRQSAEAYAFAGLDPGSPSEIWSMAADWADGGG